MGNTNLCISSSYKKHLYADCFDSAKDYKPLYYLFVVTQTTFLYNFSHSGKLSIPIANKNKSVPPAQTVQAA